MKTIPLNQKVERNLSSLFKPCRWTFYLILIVLIGIFQACVNSTPKNHEIILTYLVKNKSMYYNRTNGATLLSENPKLKVYCTVTNTSDYGGVFKFYATLSSQGNKVNFEDEQFLASGATATFSEEKEINPYSFETNVSVDEWGIIAPTKTIESRR